MGDKTPTKGSSALDNYFKRVEASPMTPRKAEKRNTMQASPASRRALDYDHMAMLCNKKPKIAEKDLEEAEIGALQVGGHQQKRLIVNIISIARYPNCVKILGCDNSGYLVITAFEKQMVELLHVVTEGKSRIQLDYFDVRRENPSYPTANYAGIEVVTNSRSSLRKLGPVVACDPPYHFVDIPKALLEKSGKVLDLIGVVVVAWDQSNSPGKPEMVLSIFDKSQQTICFSVWRGDCHYQLAIHENLIGRVIAIRNAVTSEFGGRVSIQSLWYTQVELEPAIEEAYDLFGWYEDFVKEIAAKGSQEAEEQQEKKEEETDIQEEEEQDKKEEETDIQEEEGEDNEEQEDEEDEEMSEKNKNDGGSS